jgi:hypothetical protein
VTARTWWFVAQGEFGMRQYVAAYPVTQADAEAGIVRATGSRPERVWPFRRAEDVIGERYRHGRRA